MRVKVDRLLEYLGARPVHVGIFVLIINSFVVYALIFGFGFSSDGEFWKGILVEAHGMLFDIAIIGVLILWLNKKGEKRLEIQRYKDEIDDFRYWKSEEAMHRIVGNIRRLNKKGVSSIHLNECYLKNANLSGVTLQGAYLVNATLNGAILFSTNLRYADLRNANFIDANLHTADFREADLRLALFNSKTIFPNDFNPKQAGMLYVDNLEKI